MSARAAARKPAGRGNGSQGNGGWSADSSVDEDSRAEHAQLVEELKHHVKKAELASEQYQKEMEILQMRLDEVMGERNNLEEQISQKDAEAEAVHAETKDIMRQKKELEQAHKTEKALMLKEREEQIHKEKELQSVVQRLNETMRQKEMRSFVEGDRPSLSRSGILETHCCVTLQADCFNSKLSKSSFPRPRRRSIRTLRTAGAKSLPKQFQTSLAERQND
jgi:septal ring factor EnvC (AmiA/AmiB activator)